MSSDFPPGWERVRIGDLCRIHHGFAFDGSFFSDQGPGDVLVTPGNFAIGGGFIRGKQKFYNGPVDAAYVLAPGDLVITMTDLSKNTDTLGAPAIIPRLRGEYRLLHNQRIGRVEVTRTDRVSTPFLYHALRTRAYRSQVLGSATGTTVRHTAPKRLADAVVPLPPLAEQRAIVSVLGSLDAKINSNRQLVGLLQSTVQTLFTEAVGRVTAEPVPLSSIARFVNGKAFTKDAGPSGRPIIRIKELQTGVTAATPVTDLDAQEDNIARFDDLVFSWSGTLLVLRWPGDESLINQHLFKVVPSGHPKWFVEGWVRHHLSEFRAIARDKATTMGHIRRRDLDQALVQVPEAAEYEALARQIGPLDAFRAGLQSETRHLVSASTELLPRMVSGNLRVANSDGAMVTESRR